MWYFRWFMIVAVALAFSTMADAKPAKHLRLTAKDLLDRQETVSALWPGFWSADQGFVLYDADGEALVVTRSCAALDLQRFDDDEGMEFCAYQMPAATGVTPFVQLFSLGSQVLPGARQRYQVDQYEALYNLFWQRALQYRDTWTIAADLSAAELGDWNAELVAGMHLEKELLIRALEPTRQREAEQALFRFMAARIERNKTMRAEQVRYQNQMEWREGFPIWIAYRALSAVGDFSLERLAAAYASVLKVPPNRYLELGYLFDTSIYRLTGAVMIELMHRQKLEFYAPYQAGFSPFEIIAYAYDTSTMDSAELVAAVAPPEYREAILLKAQQAIDGQRDVAGMAAEFATRGQYHLVFLECGIRNVEYDGFFHSRLPDGSDLFRRSLRTLINAPSYSAALEGGWQRMTASAEHYLGGSVEMPVDEMPDFSACVGDAVKLCAPGTHLRGDGFELDVRMPLKLSIEERMIRIEPVTSNPDHAVGLYLNPVRP